MRRFQSLSFVGASLLMILQLNGCSAGNTCPAAPTRPPVYSDDRVRGDGVQERDLGASTSSQTPNLSGRTLASDGQREDPACGSR